jgi:hypothetical protein
MTERLFERPFTVNRFSHEVDKMATNFRIFIHRNADSVHLKLSGDFDGSSAYELLHAMKSHRKKGERMFLHTDGLGEVYPFGEAVFQNRFSEVDQIGAHDLIITGDKINL